MAYFDLMSVREMIDSGFGETDSSCPVNFNMVGSVLYILARRMQLLKRNFKVQMTDLRAKRKPKSTFIITEIKIHTKKKANSSKSGMLADEVFSDKRITGKLKRSAQRRARKTSLHRTPSEKRFGDDSSSGMSSDGQVFTKKAHRRSSTKYTSSDRHTAKTSHAERSKYDVPPGTRRKPGKYFDEVFHTAKQRKSGKNSEEMPSTGHRKADDYSDEMTTSKRRKTGKHSDEISSTERRKPGKYSDEMSTSQRHRAAKYSDEMPVTERLRSRRYSDDMSPGERKKYAGKTSLRRGGKYSDQMSPYERSSKHYSPTDEFSSESVISGKFRSDKLSAQRGKADAEPYSQKDTGGRLKEAGGSNERKRRYADDDDDIEEQHEKIYVVTRTPSGRNIRQPVKSPVATQEQFKSLIARTRELEKKFGISHTNRDDLRTATSMTHPTAALNMSARLDVAETRLARMLDIFERMANQIPGIDIEAFLRDSLPPNTHGSLKVPGPETPITFTGATHDQKFQTDDTDSELDISKELGPTKSKDIVTHGQFNEGVKQIRDDIVRNIRLAMDDAGFDKCAKTMSKTEVVVNQMYHKFQDIQKLRYAIDEFGNKVVAVDERLTYEMTTIQDNLLQMNSDLDIGLEKMNDALLVPKEDQAAVAQITIEFNEYIKDLASTGRIQINLKENLEAYLLNLKNIEERIKVLRIRKCTRDEMVEKLADKLSLKDINGILTEDQLRAVTKNIRKTLQNDILAIFAAECKWQLIIDELKRKYYECAASNQIETLKESIRKCFTKMDNDLDEIVAIVGPLKRSPTDKKMERDNNCLCCQAPPEARKNELSVKLWQESLLRDSAAVISAKFTNEEIGEHCIPGYPIPHPLDQDSFVCEHDCGDTVETKEIFDLYIREIYPTQTQSEYSVATSGKTNKVEHHENA